MDPDPFGESNPFCGGEAKKAAAAPEATPAAANGAHSDEQPVDKHDDPLSFMEDDPFADPATVPRRAPAAAAAAASEQVSTGADPLSMSPAAAAMASSARSAVAGVADAAKTTAASAVQAATDAAAGLTASVVPPKYVDQDQTFEQWKASAQELGPQIERASLADKRDLAVEYARAHNVKIDPKDLSAAGETQQGLAKLCRLLRISTNGLPYRCCSRVEIEGATRNKGRGLEFPFWTYTFKVYTILDDFKGQPHHDGQGEGDFNVLGNVVMLRVTRRYRDFEWLRKCLLMENPGVVVPPIPEKTLQSIKEKMGKKDGEFRGKDLEGGDNDMGEWQNDADAKRCKGCDTQFSMLVRKHHCRHCLMIFCSTCCPKPTGGKRFCADCASLKGLSEMLMKNPDVGFRMKELQLFLQEAINSPLVDSETLQFFLEAPPSLLADRKESTLKRIEQNQSVPRSISEAAKEKLQHVSSYITTGKQAPPSEIFTGLTPRGQERLQLATRLSQMEEGFKVFRDNLAHQLFEGLSRKRVCIAPFRVPSRSAVLASHHSNKSRNLAACWRRMPISVS